MNYLKMKTKNETRRFEVIVGNIGSVELTDNYGDACKAYGEYKSQSINGYGRASREDVTLFDGGEPRLEHIGESIERFDVELTDAFGGEVLITLRETFALPSGAKQSQVIRAAKQAMGMTGVSGKTTYYGKTYEFRPYNSLVVMFVTLNDQ
jgi:hypothetical protein